MKGFSRWSVAVGLTVFTVVIGVRNAWIADDAIITLRTVNNFFEGYGLRWNIYERVQVATHPLWMFLTMAVSLPVTSFFHAVVWLCLGVTVAAVLTPVFRLRFTVWQALVYGLLLMTSKAFVDFSFAGLENPLTHLWIAVFFSLRFRDPEAATTPRTIGRLFLVAGLAAFNRMDSFLLFAPSLLHSASRCGFRKCWREAVIGLSPFLAWELFSLFYFGFPFPNTAYTKLATGFPADRLVLQGLYYLKNSVEWDPITLSVTAAALVGSFFSKDMRLISLAGGALLSIAYCVRIGGDFMSGRFLTGAFLISALLLVRFVRPPFAFLRFAVLAVALPLVSLRTEMSPLRSDASYRSICFGEHEVSDERGCWYIHNGYLLHWREWPHRRKDLVMRPPMTGMRPRPVVVLNNIGVQAFGLPPELHVVDALALSDPLLARLPSLSNVRIGHFKRWIPLGYLQTLSYGPNAIASPPLREYYDRLRLVVEGPLFDPARLLEILRMNLGFNRHLLRAYDPEEYRRVPLPFFSEPKPTGYQWDGGGAVPLDHEGIEILLPEISHAGEMFLSVDWNDFYEISLWNGASRTDTLPLFSPTEHVFFGLGHGTTAIPEKSRALGFDRVRIRAVGGDGWASIGYLKLW